MQGYDLKEGQYNTKDVSEDTLWSVFSFLFSSQSKNTTSYKFAFLKTLLDNLYNVDDKLKLTFDQLFLKFTESYWNLVLKYGIHQQKPTTNGKKSKLETILEEETKRYGLIPDIPFEELSETVKLDICKKVKVECRKYVVGAIYSDLKCYAYSFSKKEEYVQFSPYMYAFLCKHKLIIEKMNYYEWAKFMEKVNDENVLNHLLDKLDICTKRNNLTIYRQILFNEFESKTCFYCGKELKGDKVHVDHFIPWSFIKDDQLWNFVLACPKCNESKNNKLPQEMFLQKLVNRNVVIVKTYQNNKNGFMQNYSSEKLYNIYQYAKENGLQCDWRPK